MRIYQSVSELIGHTPLLELVGLERAYHLPARLFGKMECFNPAGSVKDRVALEMLLRAEMAGEITKDSVIIEPTSGNTGIGLAALAASRGMRAVIVMPDSMSPERIALMRAYGAEVMLTPGALGMQGAVDRANVLAAELPGGWIAGQFENPSNPAAHEKTTGPEIYEDTDGNVDIFVAGVGTGGTVTGVGRYLKAEKPEVKIVAVEPASSPLLSGGHAGPHKIQGIGANFIPEILDREIYDEIFCVEDADAMWCGREIAKKEGILVGISSGAAAFAAIALAKRPENAGKWIVALLPDSGERYLSTEMFRES
ncbi:MAG: cysteine synthase A [Clostridiales bacterium]|nr:MAG: cysteine synthase A [Clostridiales bacterium]